MDEKQQKLLLKINRRSRFTQFLAWLALFFTVVGIAAGYKNWLRIHDKAKAGLKGVSEIREQIPSFARKERLDRLEQLFNTELKQSKVHLDKAMHELRSIQDSTQHIAETVYTQVELITKSQSTMSRPAVQPLDWSLAEVHFLLATAEQRFQFYDDKAGALDAFKQADALLLSKGSLDYLPLRNQISLDMAAVKQYSLPDVERLSAQIDAVLKQLQPQEKIVEPDGEQVELLSVSAEPTDNEESSKSDGEIVDPQTAAPSRDTLVDRVKKTINEAVIIRKYDKPIQTEIDSDARERIYQLLSLRLESLRLMLYRRDDNGFHRQIGRIRSMLTHYYPENEYTKVMQIMDELDSANLVPAKPDISKSRILLDQMMAESAEEQS